MGTMTIQWKYKIHNIPTKRTVQSYINENTRQKVTVRRNESLPFGVVDSLDRRVTNKTVERLLAKYAKSN